MIATLSLPFLLKTPIELPPIISVELIQITDKTSIPFAPKAKKIIEKIKKEEAESALRAIRLCQPLRVPTTGYERWKDLQLNFDAREMLEG